MTESISREIQLTSRPAGLPNEENFALVSGPIPQPDEGEMLVRNIYMSVDPYMRGRMRDRKSYTPPFQIGEPLTGGCVGQVIESNDGKFAAGDYVLGILGWREYYVSDGKDLHHVDPTLAPIQTFLGTLGMPGMTAYVGLLDIGRPKAGETVFVSAASGAVGAIVCQIAKIKGCRVVGSAGSKEKVEWLVDEVGVDAAFNYKEADNLTKELAKHCPDGLDVYFENVGGEHLEAALNVMNQNGRVAVCGMIANYNATKPMPGPNNLFHIIGKRLTLQGFIITDHYDRLPQFYTDMGQWIAEGKIQWKETVFEGLENAPKAFIGLFDGQNFGKMLVKIGPETMI